MTHEGWHQAVVVGEGDHVVQYGVRHGQWHGGRFMGIEAAPGSELVLRFAAMYRFQGGRIAERWAVRDDLTMLRQRVMMVDALDHAVLGAGHPKGLRPRRHRNGVGLPHRRITRRSPPAGTSPLTSRPTSRLLPVRVTHAVLVVGSPATP